MSNIVINWMAGLIAFGVAFLFAVVFYLFCTKKKFLNVLGTLVVFGLVYYAADIWTKPYFEAWRYVQAVKKLSIVQAIANYQPEQFQAFKKEVTQVFVNKENPDKISTYLRQLGLNAFVASLSHASNDSIYRFLQSTIAFYQKLNDSNPELVIIMENPSLIPASQSPKVLQDLMTTTEGQDYVKAKENLIESQVKDIKNTMTDEQIKSQSSAIIKELGDKYGAENVTLVFTKPGDSKLDKKVGAQIIIGFYQKIKDLGKDKAGDIFRFTAKK